MNKILGCIITIFGISFTLFLLYIGIRVMLIGGIIDIINQVKASSTDATIVAMAIAKIIFSGLVDTIGLWGGILISGFGIKISVE